MDLVGDKTTSAPHGFSAGGLETKVSSSESDDEFAVAVAFESVLPFGLSIFTREE